MLLRTSLLTIAFVASSPISAQTVSDTAAKDEVLFMRSEEPAMRKAFAKAAATLPDFLKLASDPRPGTSRYALKVAISDSKVTEYFWVNSFLKDGDVYFGILNNEPRLVKKHKLGDRISFKHTQIADWTYTDDVNRKMVGNFTACALLSREPADQAAAFKRQYGLTCED